VGVDVDDVTVLREAIDKRDHAGTPPSDKE
jgi:hypothetical protein